MYPSAELNNTYKPECKLCVNFLRLISLEGFCLEGFGGTEFQNVELDRNNLESFHLQHSNLQNKYKKGKYYTNSYNIQIDGISQFLFNIATKIV